MNYILSDHIITPLAQGTEANLDAVLSGQTAIRLYTDRFASVEPFCASLFEEADFESLCVKAVKGTMTDVALLASQETVFVVSTTKGNVARLAETEDISLIDSALRITRFFGNMNTPVVVSNACISGVCALITAQRMLETGMYRHAVVVGCDVLSTFIVSGFQSFKALSPEPCMPFDAARKGLNLGEAAACMVLSSDERLAEHSYGSILAGSIHNDANHISGPSRTGEGSYRCLCDVMGNKDALAFVNVHGTATMYNDEMESIALNRAGLQDTPVNALKGYFGHTLGAAGLLETVLSLHALHRGVIIGTKGYTQQGTTQAVSIDAQTRTTDKKEFIKLLSGFGGCNAAIRMTIEKTVATPVHPVSAVRTLSEITITPTSVIRNGETLETTAQGGALLSELYRTHVGDWPKFFKMDTLAKLGFIAAELLIQSMQEERFVPRDDRAVLLANRSSCLQNDRQYQRSIMPDNYYPSPALFVYTLPNIVTGEIAIRNKYYGESSFYVLENAAQLEQLVPLALEQPQTRSLLTGWVECTDENTFEAHVKIMEKI